MTDSDEHDRAGDGGGQGRRFAIRVESGKPIGFTSRLPNNDPTSPGADEARRIVRTLKAYRAAIAELVTTKYRAVADVLPRHFRQRADVFVFRGSDGTLVRYDTTNEEKPRYLCGFIDQPLDSFVPGMTDGFVHLSSDPSSFAPPSNVGPSMMFSKVSAAGVEEELVTLRPFAVASLEATAQGKRLRPTPIVSVTNEINLQVDGIVMPVKTTSREIVHNEQFIGRTRTLLPVGWQAIEIYPPLPLEIWDADIAHDWAERDVLAMLTQANTLEGSLLRLDGRGAARQRYAGLLREFEALLVGPEEPLHQFLKRNPELICPTSISRWSKLPFGAHVSDFVFLEPHDDYVLVEIEAPHRMLFREDGQQRQELTHAINQVADWVQHIEDNKAEISETLPGISTNPRALIVIGRSESLTSDNRRKLATITSQYSKLRILTYDDVLASARSMLNQLLGPLDIKTSMQLYFFNRSPA